MPANSVSSWVQPLDTRLPRTRSSGALASNTGRPSTMVSGRAIDACMKAGIRSAGCWPSESIVSACVKPASRAIRRPCSTAAPLPWFCGSTKTRRPGSSAAICCNRSPVPSVLPSITTQTGLHTARAAATVENTRSPVL